MFGPSGVHHVTDRSGPTRRDVLGAGLVLTLGALALSLGPAAGTLSPAFVLVGALLFFAAGVALSDATLPARAFLVLVGIALVGYMFGGRGFAYLGRAPLYVGEFLLGIGLVTFLLGADLRRLARSPIFWFLAVFMAIGAAATYPYLGRYGLDALRDAVIWGYGVFAVLVAVSLMRLNWTEKVPLWYGRILPWFVLWAPLLTVLHLSLDVALPTVPGTDVELFALKRGDTAVHLAGALAFLTLGLHRRVATASGAAIERREWILWACWLAGFAAVTTARAAILTVVVVFAVLALLRPTRQWWKLLVVAGLGAAAFVAFEIDIPADRNRSISAAELVVAVRSIVSDDSESGYEGTREWRLDWWRDIVDYTLLGPLFWEGKGFGVNLATDDGYQSHIDDTLRSPHNGHMTVLARSGVPGAVAWLVLQGSFAIALLRAHLRHRRAGRSWTARLRLWVLVYWLAFVTNASFDVFLEGPQGGIWFWCLFGFGLALLAQPDRDAPRGPRGGSTIAQSSGTEGSAAAPRIMNNP